MSIVRFGNYGVMVSPVLVKLCQCMTLKCYMALNFTRFVPTLPERLTSMLYNIAENLQFFHNKFRKTYLDKRLLIRYIS